MLLWSMLNRSALNVTRLPWHWRRARVMSYLFRVIHLRQAGAQINSASNRMHAMNIYDHTWLCQESMHRLALLNSLCQQYQHRKRNGTALIQDSVSFGAMVELLTVKQVKPLLALAESASLQLSCIVFSIECIGQVCDVHAKHTH